VKFHKDEASSPKIGSQKTIPKSIPAKPGNGQKWLALRSPNAQQKTPSDSRLTAKKTGFCLMSPAGLEPTTHGLKVVHHATANYALSTYLEMTCDNSQASSNMAVTLPVTLESDGRIDSELSYVICSWDSIDIQTKSKIIELIRLNSQVIDALYSATK
jgi:hypothetical protein